MYKPMLATNVEIKDLRLPVMVSTKLEGVRAQFTPTGLKTRPMKRFNNKALEIHFKPIVDYCIENLLYMEGEIYVHGLAFNEISSICRRSNHKDTINLNVYVFDLFDSRDYMRFKNRYKRLCGIVDWLKQPNIHIAEYSLEIQHEEIQDMYEDALDDGYEGLCFKSPDEYYKLGRSTKNEQKFLRIKDQQTWDGVVIEIVERMENLVESVPNELGYLAKTQNKDMKAHTGLAAVAITKVYGFTAPIRVTLSRGLTDGDRAEIWMDRAKYTGKHIRFVGIPVKGMLPRAPRFDAWRTDLDD